MLIALLQAGLFPCNPPAGYSGGGIYNGGTLTLTNSTVSGNTAEDLGGGIINTGASATAKLANTIVAGNTAISGGPDASGTFISQGTNLIANFSG